jgi:hypothetical protein
MSHSINFNIHDPSLSFSSMLCQTALLGCAGAAAATIFTSVGAIGGAFFAASGFLSHRLITWVCESLNCCPNSLLARVATFAAAAIGGVVAAIGVTAALGIKITLATAVVLTIGTLATAGAAILIFAGCFCSAAAAVGVALGNDQHQVLPF